MHIKRVFSLSAANFTVLKLIRMQVNTTTVTPNNDSCSFVGLIPIEFHFPYFGTDFNSTYGSIQSVSKKDNPTSTRSSTKTIRCSFFSHSENSIF